MTAGFLMKGKGNCVGHFMGTNGLQTSASEGTLEEERKIGKRSLPLLADEDMKAQV